MKIQTGLKVLTGSTLGLALLMTISGRPVLAQIEVEEGAIFTGDITGGPTSIETLDNDCGTNISQRSDDGTPNTVDNNIEVTAQEDAFEGNGSGCATSTSEVVGETITNENIENITASPDNTSTTEAITSGDATSSVDGGFSESNADVNGGNSISEAAPATGGSSTTSANQGDVTQGDTTFGAITRGNSVFGDVTRGDSVFGEVTRGDTSFGEITQGDTDLGDNSFEADVVGGTADISESTDTTGGDIFAGSADQNQVVETIGGDITGGTTETTGGTADLTGGTTDTTGGFAEQTASVTGGSADQSQFAETTSGPATTNSGDLTIAPITVNTTDSSVDNSIITINDTNSSTVTSSNNNSVVNTSTNNSVVTSN